MPVGTHLILHEYDQVKEILADGQKLGRILEEAAQRFCTPLAIPLMNLSLEKTALLSAGNVPAEKIDSYHFSKPPTGRYDIALTPQMKVSCDAVRYIALNTELLPIGMAIGPFSLMTKLVSDPITPVFMAGTGATADEEIEIAVVEKTLELAEKVIRIYLEAQIKAGAKAVFICEPAANKVYFSPKQLEAGYEVFDRYVMEPNRRLKEFLVAHDVDLIFHDCGELTDEMVRRFGTLDPAILSMGSSRRLWEDASLVHKTTVLYGNLPSKHFSSDAYLSVQKVEDMARELIDKMHTIGHPFILGSECDVLSVPNCEASIWDKVNAFMECHCGGRQNDHASKCVIQNN
ncbi:MAG: uroporphyrinogen decarboxylase family protein [Methylacidiphilales bacterium]|nr:uroporphyrinogen decarboxylase family protein [Candidatus Methylacidiphilales bacterium]